MIQLCRGCDTPITLPNTKQALNCPRCGTKLRPRVHALSTSMALAATAALLFVLLQSFPLLSLQLGGLMQSMNISRAVGSLWHAQQQMIATLLAITLIIAPGAEISILLWLGLTPGNGRAPRRWLFRLLHFMRTWNMLEVCALALLVSMVKLADIANVIPGVAFYALFALFLTTIALNTRLDEQALAGRIGAPL